MYLHGEFVFLNMEPSHYPEKQDSVDYIGMWQSRPGASLYMMAAAHNQEN